MADFWGIEEMAKRMSVSSQSISHWIRYKGFPAYRRNNPKGSKVSKLYTNDQLILMWEMKQAEVYQEKRKNAREAQKLKKAASPVNV